MIKNIHKKYQARESFLSIINQFLCRLPITVCSNKSKADNTYL